MLSRVFFGTITRGKDLFFVIWHSKLVYFLSIYTKMTNNSKNNFYDCASSPSKSDRDVDEFEGYNWLHIYAVQW